MTNAEKALQLHKEWNGKFETTPKMSITTREDLALAYTPGVAEPCKVIAKDKEAAMTRVKFADADSLLCDAGQIFKVVRHILSQAPECIVTSPIEKSQWQDFTD